MRGYRLAESIPAPERCPKCNGYGETYQRAKWGETYADPCTTCKGTGRIC